MQIPIPVHNCITALEQAGFEAYCVGGCVRDWLLGIAPHDFDLTTSATPEEMHRIFAGLPLVTAGEKHGTVGVVFDKEVIEITTFRTEGTYADSRHPDWVTFVRNLPEDLSRRDFTINAMAWSPSHGLRDPFGGEADLKAGILRAVGDPHKRFREDALRILRGMRFAARFGLTIENATWDAMLAEKARLDTIAGERIFTELSGLLLTTDASHLLTYAPIIAQLIPELEPAIGFDQHSPHHAYDIYTHICHVVQAAPRTPPLRWAALLHDVGKVSTYAPDETGRGHFYGHAKVGSEMADEIMQRLKFPGSLRTQVVALIARHMTYLEPDRKLLRRRVSQYGAQQTQMLLELQRSDFNSKGVIDQAPEFDRIQAMLQQILAENSCLGLKDLAVDGNDLKSMGFPPGKAMGSCLNRLLEEVLDEKIPNEKPALLERARQILEECI